jgi:hypothetical protein
MRIFAKVGPNFWTGKTGRAINSLENRDPVRVLAIYVLTSPHANVFGLYQLPLAVAAHQTGRTVEQVLELLIVLQELEFCGYDEDTEFIWVYEMAEHQLDLPLKENDWKRIWAARWFLTLEENPFLCPFYERYRDGLKLPERKAPSKPLGSPLEAPSKGQSPSPSQSQSQSLPPSHFPSQESVSSQSQEKGAGGKNDSAVVLQQTWTNFIEAADHKLGRAFSGPLIAGTKLVRIDRRGLYVVHCTTKEHKDWMNKHAPVLRQLGRDAGMNINRFVLVPPKQKVHR